MISNRMSNITPSFTIGISSKVTDLKNSGEIVTDLSIGEPEFNIPDKSKLYGIESIIENKTKYDSVYGLTILREKICDKLFKENNCTYSPDEIVVSNGAKHAITNTMLALLDPNDDVLIPVPYWVSYPEIIKLVNCNPIFVQTQESNNFKVTVNDIDSNKTSKTKLLILNNPSNPTGIIYSKKELIDIIDYCYDNNIYILSDEIYEKLCYDESFISVASINDKAKDITVTINGFSKSASMTGLRIGYSASNKSIAKCISTIQGHLTSHPCLTSQYIAYGVLNNCSNDINSNIDIYRSRRDLVISKLNEINNINYISPQGAFYVFINLSNICSKFNYKDSFSVEFCERLLDEYRVAVVPGIAFGLDNWVRISFANDEDSVINGINKLHEFISSICNN